jgi:hypothetical protein
MICWTVFRRVRSNSTVLKYGCFFVPPVLSFTSTPWHICSKQELCSKGKSYYYVTAVQALFSVRSVPWLYNEDQLPLRDRLWQLSTGMEGGSKYILYISHCKIQTGPLVREDAPHQQTRNCQTEEKSGLKSQMCAWHQDRMADWPLVVT